MLRRVFLWVACAALCSLSVPALAQQVGAKVVVTYNTLGMSQPIHGSIVDVGSDATNRVWAVAPTRVSAALGSVRAPLFPIDLADTALAPTARFRSVSFAVPQGVAADGEHFFLGSSAGIAWGRLTSTVDHKPSALLVTPPGIPGDDPNDVSETDISVDQTTGNGISLWAATSGGLVRWDLTQADPTSDTFLDSASDGPIDDVAAAPWGDAAAVDAERLLLVDTAGNATLLRDLGADAFLGITFDDLGNLWAITDASLGGHPTILKFEANGDPGATPPVDPTGFTGVVESFPLNPFVPAGAPAGFLPTDIAVAPFTGRVWVSTESSNQGPMRTAYFQNPVDITSRDLETDPTVNSWGEVTSTFDQHSVVHADASGNAWFGMLGTSGEALNGYVVRLLTLDKSRYLGNDSGVASLLDLALFGDNGTPDEQATITIAVGSDSRPFTVTEQGDSGQFAQGFQIVPSGAAGGTGAVFEVSSSTDDIPVEASYTFDDANNQPRELTATASWANIVDFEDDLWIGSGPCFLRSLEW